MVIECERGQVLPSSAVALSCAEHLSTYCFGFTVCNFTVWIHSQRSHQPHV